ncbi:MAG: hypothetical protein NC816_00775 [Candidatus Omnitrophica bacterium]|nr:hypothetical protein [Candidatus Omnitrophota bacterium]
MGCDIHCIVEVYNKDSGEWEYLAPDGRWSFFLTKDTAYYSSIYDKRNYQLFGALAGVRGDPYDDYSTPIGWPKNMSSYAEKLIQDENYHSHSYFTLRELLEWKLWRDKKFIYSNDITDFYISCVAEMMLLGDPDEVRLLIMFDN